MGDRQLSTKCTIGWVENISLQLWDALGVTSLLNFKAKVDTGAFTSSLHAVNPMVFHRDNRLFVRFSLPNGDGLREVEAPLHKRGIVKTSEGRREFRYFVQSQLFIGRAHAPVVFSLNDRSGMLYPVLLGRNFLKDGYLVDVSRKFLLDLRLAASPAAPYQYLKG